MEPPQDAEEKKATKETLLIVHDERNLRTALGHTPEQAGTDALEATEESVSAVDRSTAQRRLDWLE